MRILIVDDSQIHLRRLKSLLEKLGHEVSGQARTGSEAIKLFKEDQPDLVFLDIVMPEMDGITCLRTMRSIDESAKVFVVTTMAGVGGQVEKALQLGALDVIPKPVQDDDIKKALVKAAG